MTVDLPPAVAARAEKPKKAFPGRTKSHSKMPGKDKPNARGVYVAQEFRDASEKAAAATKRSTDDRYEPPEVFEARRETMYSLSQLSPEQIAGIEADYRAALMKVEDLCSKHRIVKSTMYSLAQKRGWPLQSEIRRQMAEAVQDRVVTMVAADLRLRQSGDVSQPVNPSGLSALLNDAAQVLLPAGNRGSDGEALTQRALDDMANQDRLVEEYAIQCALVLVQHRTMAGTAVKACHDLIEVQQAAVARAREKAKLYEDSPEALAKLLEPLVKTLGTTITTMQRAIELQRQAFAIDEMAGKGMAITDQARMRAAQAGFVRHDQLAAPAAGAAAPVPEGESEAPGTITLPPEVGSYEALVREAERRGVGLAS